MLWQLPRARLLLRRAVRLPGCGLAASSCSTRLHEGTKRSRLSPSLARSAVQICHHGLVLLALDKAPEEHATGDETHGEHKTAKSATRRAIRDEAPVKRAALDRVTVVDQLTSLRREVEAANLPLEKLTPPFALFLSDVCRVLGLTAAEHDHILGPEAAAYVTSIRKRRWWSAKESPWRQLSRLLQQGGHIAAGHRRP